MRNFLLIFILTFSFQSLSKADDIRDFEIEGISIGNSLLDHFDITKIKEVIGWEPKHSMNEGMKKLLNWLVSVQKDNLGSDASNDLEKFGLLK